ncbi:IS110 family transposase [Ornithinimicrobium sediminis]|uniref:IS110 family transposase n=1 Tax=Ornithinimicrobium sediminis TaxID=2904603 RepID=UPI001E3EBD80|nr:IS110 family transposase [Ornithinimicrobium sediminis]MCE0487401.1 IS110 family transposase [Ornithinimicrobium sediminis]
MGRPEAVISVADAELKALVETTEFSLMGLHGIGPSGAARLLVEVGEVSRFPDRNHAVVGVPAPAARRRIMCVNTAPSWLSPLPVSSRSLDPVVSTLSIAATGEPLCAAAVLRLGDPCRCADIPIERRRRMGIASEAVAALLS